jgi:hypothetical protein
MLILSACFFVFDTAFCDLIVEDFSVLGAFVITDLGDVEDSCVLFSSSATVMAACYPMAACSKCTVCCLSTLPGKSNFDSGESWNSSEFLHSSE